MNAHLRSLLAGVLLVGMTSWCTAADIVYDNSTNDLSTNLNPGTEENTESATEFAGSVEFTRSSCSVFVEEFSLWLPVGDHGIEFRGPELVEAVDDRLVRGVTGCLRAAKVAWRQNFSSDCP